MRKPVVPRIFGLLGLYTLIFVLIVGIQFTKKGNFSLQVGDMLAEGQYRVLEEGESVPYNMASPLTGELSVFYGGLEFRLFGNPVSSRTDREGFLYLIDAAGNRYAGTPEYLVQEDGGLRLYITGGVELFLSAPADGELRISGSFGDDIFTGLEIPYRPLKSSRVRDTGNGQFVIIADGQNYHFSRAGPDGRQVLVLQRGALPISYGIVGEEKVFNPEEYILAEAQEAGPYGEALAQWVDRNYALWGRLIASRNDEDLAIAYQAESLRRGAFKTAFAAVSRTFLNGTRRTYESSVYLGGMVAAQRGFTAAEAERLARITRLINENSADILLESHCFEYLIVRNQENLINQGIALIRNLESASLAQIPGLLEALTDLGAWPDMAWLGPDEPLALQAQLTLSRYLKRSAGMVLAFQENSANIAWNLRLGKALEDWGLAANQAGWAAIGRSIVLSVLSLEDGEGQVAASLNLNAQGEFLPGAEGSGSIDAGRIYRLLEIGEYHPRALAISPASADLWAWTASRDVTVTREGQILDLAVNFPLGESHYMLVRGVDPFYRLQFYGMDWRSDPQFERYDSSGWVYYPQDRILVLKVKHRSPVEYIRLYLGSSPPPPPPVETPPAGGMAATGESATAPETP